MSISTLKVNTSKAVAAIKSIIPPFIYLALYKALIVKNIPDASAYKPHYSAWFEPDFQKLAKKISSNTGLKPESLYTLLHFLKESLSLEGDVMECGVWRGGSAKLIFETVTKYREDKKVYLFDSFEGMRKTDVEFDRHKTGDFRDTSLDYVKNYVFNSVFDSEKSKMISFHKGWIPESFQGLDNLKLCFAHIDLDLYKSILDTLNFVYPKLSSGGVIVFDDYGFASCPGARKAVDDFFSDKPESPFSLSTAQALIFKK